MIEYDEENIKEFLGNFPDKQKPLIRRLINSQAKLIVKETSDVWDRINNIANGIAPDDSTTAQFIKWCMLDILNNIGMNLMVNSSIEMIKMGGDPQIDKTFNIIRDKIYEELNDKI